MKFIKELLKILRLPYILMFTDFKFFIVAFLLFPLLTLAFLIPILGIGIVIGFGVQLSNYLTYLWSQAANDTKLTIVVGVLIGFLALPPFLSFLISLFKKTRQYFKSLEGKM